MVVKIVVEYKQFYIIQIQFLVSSDEIVYLRKLPVSVDDTLKEHLGLNPNTLTQISYGHKSSGDLSFHQAAP